MPSASRSLADARDHFVDGDAGQLLRRFARLQELVAVLGLDLLCQLDNVVAGVAALGQRDVLTEGLL